MVWDRRDLKDYLVPTVTAIGRDTFYYTKMLKFLFNLILNTSRGGVPTTPLGNLF